MYVPIPEPADEVVIVEGSESSPAFTWGDHRQMKAMLDELESQDADVASARQRLDYTLREAGWLSPEGNAPVWCSFCYKRPEEAHDIECPDSTDPSLFVTRERAGYQWFSETFQLLHTSSAPMNDEEAIAYSSIVEIWSRNHKVKYLWGRDLDEYVYKMLPYVITVDENRKVSWVAPGS